MSNATSKMRGFTLIASMLMLVLLSSIAIGLMFLANGAGHAGNNDLESNVAYYGASRGWKSSPPTCSACISKNCLRLKLT